MQKKAQVITEFLVYFGVTLILFVSVTLFVLSEQGSTVKEQEESAIEAFAVSLQNDLMVSSTMKVGFTRQIELEPTINGKPYTLQILASNLYVTQGDSQIVLALPSVQGNISSYNFTVTMNSAGLLVQ